MPMTPSPRDEHATSAASHFTPMAQRFRGFLPVVVDVETGEPLASSSQVGPA